MARQCHGVDTNTLLGERSNVRVGRGNAAVGAVLTEAKSTCDLKLLATRYKTQVPAGGTGSASLNVDLNAKLALNT